MRRRSKVALYFLMMSSQPTPTYTTTTMHEFNTDINLNVFTDEKSKVKLTRFQATILDIICNIDGTEDKFLHRNIKGYAEQIYPELTQDKNKRVVQAAIRHLENFGFVKAELGSNGTWKLWRSTDAGCDMAVQLAERELIDNNFPTLKEKSFDTKKEKKEATVKGEVKKFEASDF